ncbi:MAG: RNA polymerase sigma factor [Pseudomonadales bacterium]|nr:RNA polymerase sigma factor [Pseudomonadales bacterium]
MLRLARDHDRADDLAQETFIKAFRKIGSYRNSGSFSAWLFSIAHNCFLEQQRSRQRRQEVYQQFGQQVELTADRFEHVTGEQLDLERALLQLSPEQAAALTLCHSYGFSHSEAAEILKIPLGTLKTNIARGKERLLRILDAAPGDAGEMKSVGDGSKSIGDEMRSVVDGIKNVGDDIKKKSVTMQEGSDDNLQSTG